MPRPATDAAVALRSLETLEAAYELWAERRLARAALRRRHTEERARLDQQAAFLVGTVRAAQGGAGEPALERAGDPLGQFVAGASGKLDAARAALDRQAAAELGALDAELARLEAELHERVARFAARSPPRLRLVARPLGPGRHILHVERLGRDEAVLALHALTGRIPSRYDFLFDDSTEDVALPPAPLYPEEGVEQLRPGAAGLRRELEARPRVLPIKGFLPVFTGAGFVRLLQRGPVMEAELQEGEGFRSVLTREEAEAVAGQLLKLQLEGKVHLELVMS